MHFEITSALIGAAAGLIVGVGTTYLTLKFNYRQLFAETVSKSRMQWIDNFRDELSTILAAHKVMNKNKINSKEYDFEKARFKLLTRLNMDTSRSGNEYNEVFSNMLQGLQSNESDVKDYTDILDISKKILESEWKRVKNEARGEIK